MGTWEQRQFQLNPQLIMNSLKIARVALRARPAAIKAPLLRRGYAEAVSDKIKLSLVLPHQSIYKSQGVVQVNIPAESGEMGILANHVPSIEQLKPDSLRLLRRAVPASSSSSLEDLQLSSQTRN